MVDASDSLPHSRKAYCLKERVERKRDLLNKWLIEGVPHNYLETLPTSLNAARVWTIPELGIQPIGSPNSFTTTHVDVGEEVKAISDLVRKLQSKLLTPKRNKKISALRPTISAKDIEKTMSALVSQWHAARNDALHWKEQAVRAQKHRDIAREELKARDAEIAELRRRLAGGLSLVK